MEPAAPGALTPEAARRAEVKPGRRIFHACNSLALAFLPPYVARRTDAIPVRDVQIP